MVFNSIRWRVQAWHGLILFVVLAAFGFTAYRVSFENLMRRIDQELDQRLMFLARPQPPDHPPDHPPGSGPGAPPERRFGGPHGEPGDFRARLLAAIDKAAFLDPSQTNAFYSILWDTDGAVLVRSPGAPTEVPQPTAGEDIQPRFETKREPPREPGPGRSFAAMPPAARQRGEARELYRFLPRGECLMIGRSIASDLAAMRHFALLLVAAGSGVLMLGLAGGWWVASRAIRPVEDISATAMKIAAGDLSQRINAADTDNELGRLAAILNSTFARLEAAFGHQARFTSDASHELRTPVSVILSQTQTALNRGRSAAEYVEALQACQRAAQRMRSLIESLLELARLDAGQELMKRTSFDLGRAARECVELVRPLAAERGIELHLDLAEAQCQGDADRIAQVITNLLTNAIHFNRSQGTVRVSSRPGEGGVTLSVTDTGEGIPGTDLPHIFERFYRVDKSRSRVAGRSGLGLAISKAIVDAHGGTLEVESEQGKGSIFTLKLPR